MRRFCFLISFLFSHPFSLYIYLSSFLCLYIFSLIFSIPLILSISIIPSLSFSHSHTLSLIFTPHSLFPSRQSLGLTRSISLSLSLSSLVLHSLVSLLLPSLSQRGKNQDALTDRERERAREKGQRKPNLETSNKDNKKGLTRNRRLPQKAERGKHKKK